MEIGSFEGRSSLWFLENILTHEEATLTCVDVPQYEHVKICQDNLSDFDNVNFVLSTSTRALAQLIHEGQLFDFIYVDGQHHDFMPLQDMVMSHPILRVGGLMAIDDYAMPDSIDYGASNVGKSFHYFMNLYGNYYQVLGFHK